MTKFGRVGGWAENHVKMVVLKPSDATTNPRPAQTPGKISEQQQKRRVRNSFPVVPFFIICLTYFSRGFGLALHCDVRRYKIYIQ